MRYELIIEQLRALCPVFENRVAGAAEFKNLAENQALSVPCAYVIPLDENVEGPGSLNAVRQNLTEGFAVVVALSNTIDEKGHAATVSLDAMRANIWRALLGWRPLSIYNGIYYDGGSLLSVDRARLWYQFEFAAQMQIGPSDGWEEGFVAALPPLDSVGIDVDVIEPIAQPSPGPDGRIEFHVEVSNLNP